MKRRAKPRRIPVPPTARVKARCVASQEMKPRDSDNARWDLGSGIKAA
jgi:hypothetical protein